MDVFMRQLAGAEAEREAITDILKTCLVAAEQALQTHREILKSTEQLAQIGVKGNQQLLQARPTVVNSQAKLQELQVLLDFYSDLGRTR